MERRYLVLVFIFVSINASFLKNEHKAYKGCAHENDHCGGFKVNAPICCEGLKCKLSISNPDSGGICVIDKCYYAPCGPVTTCCVGFTCKIGSIPNAGGVCVKY